MNFDIAQLDVIYAEDEESFRMLTVPVFLQAGILEENIHIAETGEEAIDHLNKLQAHSGRPLLMLLDVRMPQMDGHTCAQAVQRLATSNQITRCPYVAIYTAGILSAAEMQHDSNRAVMISIPKPMNSKQMKIILEAMDGWLKRPDSLSAGGASSSLAYDASQMQVIIASDEPICSMALFAHISQVDIDDDQIVEAGSLDEIADRLDDARDSAPILILLSCPTWIGSVQEIIARVGKKVFVVRSSVDQIDDDKSKYNAILPENFCKAELQSVLEKCHADHVQER